MATETSGLQAIFNKFLSKASPTDIRDMLTDATLSKAIDTEADSMERGEVVLDQFAAGNTDTVATAEEVKVGPAEAATGANAEKQISHYSPNQVPQHGLTERGTQIGQLVAQVGSMGKSIALMNQQMKILSAGLVQVLEKSVTKPAVAAPAVAVAKADEPEKKEEKDDEKDDEKAKSLMVTKATAEFATAKSLVTQAEELEGDGRNGTAKSRRAEAQVALAKAQTLLGAATALGASGAAVDKLNGAIATFAQAKSMECSNQAHYPDSHKGDETAKGTEPATADALVKAQEQALAKAAEIQAALEGLTVLKTDVQGMLAAIAGKSMGSGVVPGIGALAKSDPSGYARSKGEEMMRLQDEGIFSDSDIMAVQDIFGKMQGVQIGVVTPAVVTSRIQAASTAVREFFKDAA